MSGAGNTLPRCDPEIGARGTLLFVTHTIPARAIEAWVKKIRARCGQPVDWHYSGGRACILALGDVQWAKDALVALLPEHDEAFRAACRGLIREQQIQDFIGDFHASLGLPRSS